MSNLDLWDKVKKTDPIYTKYVDQRGGYTSVSPQYQIKCATEQFGMYGQGWGFLNISFDYGLVDTLGLVIVRAEFFYVINDKQHSFPINNAWPIKVGNRVDQDFAKKAETNTMSKALSKLGFSADVFMGDFEDRDYVEAVTNEFALEKAENKIEEKEKQDEEYNKWVASSLEILSTCQSMSELKKVYTGLVRKADLYKDKPTALIFDKAKNERKAHLESEE